MQLPIKTILALLPFFIRANALASGTGTTTRYWDCCKPSCAWSGKATLASGSNPVTTCDINNNPLMDPNAESGCASGGTAFQCSNESPWAVTDDLAYGYAAVKIEGGDEASWCCACYELTFTSGPVAGKTMIVQATNTGSDLAGNQFDISIPGGGVGLFNGCTTEWGAPSSGWGAQYGGISSSSDCASLPEALQAGCYWRFGWFMGADNPTVSFTQVSCPAAITANTGCVRADDSSAPAAPSASGSAVVASSSIVEMPAAGTQASTSAAQQEVANTISASQEEATSSTTPASLSAKVSAQSFATSIATPSPTAMPTISAEPETITVVADACEL